MPVEDSKPDVTTDAYDAMMVYWDLPLTLRGGTPAMVGAGKKYLPEEPEEEPKAYNIRLGLATLFGGYDDTIMKLASRPFTKPVTVENIPTELEYLIDNADGDETSITDVANDLTEAMVDLGVSHILVDFSVLEANKEGTASKKEEKESGARVNFIHYRAEDVIWWDVGDDGKLVEVRFKESKLVNGKSVSRVRVWSKVDWQIWELDDDAKTDKEKWRVLDEGPHTFGSIPLVSVYAKKTGKMTGRPPLYNLADQNLAHWKMTADYKAGLRFALFGIIFAKGIDPKKTISVGPGSVFKTKDTQGDMKYVEHNGHSISAGQKELEDTERRMEIMGLQPLVRATGVETATGKGINESRSQAPMQRWARNIEEGIEQAFRLAARWHKVDLPDDFQVTVFKEFALSSQSANNMTLLLESTKANKFSTVSYLAELKRYGAINEDLEIEAEIARIEGEMVTSFKLFETEEDIEDEEDTDADDN